MTSPNQVIENQLSGERITIIERPRVTGDALVWELLLAPGGRVPNSHSHPEQEERFTVCDGVVPRGTVHHFASPGTTPARALMESVPRPPDLASFMRVFDRELRAPYLPAALVRAVLRPVGRLAGLWAAI